MPHPRTRTSLLLLLGCLAAGPLGAQYFRQSTYWKTHREELTLGLGMSNFLGELGGRDQIGSPFVWDIEFSQTRPSFSFSYRYFTKRKQAIRAGFTYGILAGNDNLTKEPFRENRNLHFKSDVFEFQIVYELHLYREELGHVYDLRGVKGTKANRVGFYFFGGIGGFYFDPRAQINNEWVRLKPMGTEGQGLPGGADEYGNYQLCIPMGVGFRKAFTRELCAGLELQYTKTFTDYVDDVSGVYYNNEALRRAHGNVAAFLADPNLRRIEGQTATGQQRGDPEDLDAYLFLKLHVHYKLYNYKNKSAKYRYRLRRQKTDL